MGAFAADLTIDHVTMAGPSLGPMQTALEKAGLYCEYGGPHANHATEMALASFPDGSYLELIAIQPKADAAAVAKHAWTKYMKGDAGPCAWAVRSPNVGVEAERLRKTGVPIGPPERSGRVRPDGFRLDWETAGTADHGVCFPFLIRDFTPREKRAFPNGKPNNPQFAGVSKVLIAVKDLPAAVDRYRETYDLPKPEEENGRAWFPGTPVILVAWPRRVNQFGEGVTAFILKSNSTAQGERWFGKHVHWVIPDRLALED
jgi:hypothetical protein